MDNFIDAFAQISILCKRFAKTVSGYKFDENNEAAEIFGLVCLKLSISYSNAISLLLKNNLIPESISIIRILFETVFSIKWICDMTEKHEKNERAFQLEGTPLFFYEKEIDLIKKNYSKNILCWDRPRISEFKEQIERIKVDRPLLTIKDKKGNIKFKQALCLADRMGDLRWTYYHIYRFTSIFVHPTPFIKGLLLKEIDNIKESLEIYEIPLKSTLAHGLLFIELIIGYLIDLFKHINPDTHSSRIQICNEISDIVNEQNKGYFVMPKFDK